MSVLVLIERARTLIFEKIKIIKADLKSMAIERKNSRPSIQK